MMQKNQQVVHVSHTHSFVHVRNYCLSMRGYLSALGRITQRLADLEQTNAIIGLQKNTTSRGQRETTLRLRSRMQVLL